MAEVRARYEDEKYLLQRLAAYDTSLIPDGRARIAAALAGLRAGRNQFRDVLEARRAALETQLSRLDLLTDGLKASVELAYFGAYQPIQNQQATADE
jgi:outer membrane protein TolC